MSVSLPPFLTPKLTLLLLPYLSLRSYLLHIWRPGKRAAERGWARLRSRATEAAAASDGSSARALLWPLPVLSRHQRSVRRSSRRAAAREDRQLADVTVSQTGSEQPPGHHAGDGWTRGVGFDRRGEGEEEESQQGESKT
eukprot:SAG31_NODE_1411_length_8466_cov_18.216565_7_plen_140_part_00